MKLPLITRDLLEQMVAAHRAAYDETGSFKERRDHDEAAHRADFCLKIMKDRGVHEVANIGPFGVPQLAKGTRIRIRKGAKIFTTHPRKYNAAARQLSGCDYEAKTSHVVTVDHMNCGFVTSLQPYVNERKAKDDNIFTEASITWAGTGGYWCWVQDMKDIEILD